MKFYQSVLGGELKLTRRGEVDPTAPEDMKPLIINAELTSGELTLRGADNTDTPTERQHRMSLTLIGSDEAKLRHIYDQLAAGGSADHPLDKMFWGDIFGELTDKYGITWQINILAAK